MANLVAAFATANVDTVVGRAVEGHGRDLDRSARRGAHGTADRLHHAGGDVSQRATGKVITGAVTLDKLEVRQGKHVAAGARAGLPHHHGWARLWTLAFRRRRTLHRQKPKEIVWIGVGVVQFRGNVG